MAEERIGARECLLYLFGHEESIRKLARSDKSIYLGAFFVLIAGIAREYDQEYLGANPWPFATPYLVSLIICLYVRLFCQLDFRKSLNPNGLGPFRVFLSLFWLTAPCAWIYGFPVEQFFDSLPALKINMTLLGIVTLWRVLLFSQVMKVLTGVHVLWAVLAGAAPVIAVASLLANITIVGVMSGGYRTQEQDLLLGMNGLVGAAALLLTIPLLIIYLYHGFRTIRTFTPFEPLNSTSCRRSLKVVCTLLLLALLSMMIRPQQQLQRLMHLKHLTEQKRYEEAIEYANQLEEVDFPVTRKMYPPPTSAYRDLGTSMALFARMKGNEKAWLRRDIEKWVATGLQSPRRATGFQVRRSGITIFLKSCPITDYHIGFLKQFKDAIAADMRRTKSTPELKDWMKALGIEQEPEEEE